MFPHNPPPPTMLGPRLRATQWEGSRGGTELPHLRAWALGCLLCAALLTPGLSFLRLSFYSGHSSFGMYCMMFLAVSLVPRVGFGTGRVAAFPGPQSLLP